MGRGWAPVPPLGLCCCWWWVWSAPWAVVRGSEDIVVGCGGFVKSDVEINYSLIEIKLYTKHGTLKYQTDCAPNNGYFMIPLYDKGDFVLKIEPPLGWSFDPTSVDIHVDGINDICTKGGDINFVFTGFSVNGKVLSKGQTLGPAGVLVVLRNPGSEVNIQATITQPGGKFCSAAFKRKKPRRKNRNKVRPGGTDPPGPENQKTLLNEFDLQVYLDDLAKEQAKEAEAKLLNLAAKDILKVLRAIRKFCRSGHKISPRHCLKINEVLRVVLTSAGSLTIRAADLSIEMAVEDLLSTTKQLGRIQQRRLQS